MYENLFIEKKKRLINWKTIPIKENGEELVSLKKYASKSKRIVLDPRYYKDGHKGAINDIYARVQVYSKLLKAAMMLPKGYKLVIWDCYRPTAVQESLFKKIFDGFRTDINKWSNYNDEDLKHYIEENCCSLPSINPYCPAPHNTGGAVDLSILDENGKLMKMGTDFDEFKSTAHTRYYEEKLEKGERLTKEEQKILQNRRLLYYIMLDSGFKNFSEEWWHYDFGNQFWASYTGDYAIYGAAKLNKGGKACH